LSEEAKSNKEKYEFSFRNEKEFSNIELSLIFKLFVFLCYRVSKKRENVALLEQVLGFFDPEWLENCNY
jgi:hypothetical protein